MPHKERLGTGTKVVYATGAAIDGITNSVLPTFLFFYLTAVCGLGATLAGFAVSCSLVIDAVADPFIGSMSDNHFSRWGRRHPFMLASALPMAITLGLLFSIPVGLSKWVLFTYVVLTLLALRIAVSAWVLPYQALGAELADDYDERSTIVAYRVFFAMPGVAICLSLGFLVFLRGPNGLLNRAAYVPFGWACGFFILLSALTATFGTRRLIGRLHQPAKQTRGSLSRFVREVRQLLQHRSFLILSSAATIFFIALTASTTLGLHAGKFFYKLPNGVLQAMSLSLFIAPILGILLVALCSRHFEKRTLAVAGIGYVGVSLLVLPVLKIIGVLPESGLGLFVPLVANSILTGMFVGSSTIVYQSMFVDAADEHQVLYGARREGLFYAGLSLAVKCGAGLGALLAGVALDLIAFPADIAHRNPALAIPAKTIDELGLVYGPVPAVITLLAAALLLGYRLNRREHARIRGELDQRAAGAQAGK